MFDDQVQIPVFHFQFMEPAADDAGFVVGKCHGISTGSRAIAGADSRFTAGLADGSEDALWTIPQRTEMGIE
ncbi:hypothetical protein AZSI13_22380 [Azospira sp. I13]|nr:hypothetical protein AZSI13_22380 [Azospira sp. I13]